MKIKYVTMTGADDNTSVEGMVELSGRFPFAEWGILFSQARAGVARYPSLDWVDNDLFFAMNLSAHLCGKWVDDVMKIGRISFLNDDLMDEIFGRVQLNLNKDRLRKAFADDDRLIWDAVSESKPIMIGGNYTDDIFSLFDVRDFFLNEGNPLFDASGGRGLNQDTWPVPLGCNDTTLLCGYAGGLGPDNLQEKLEIISEIVGEVEIWIDMETKLRTKDEFDLKKCERVLEMAEPWTK